MSIHVSRTRKNEKAFTHLDTSTNITTHIASERLVSYLEASSVLPIQVMGLTEKTIKNIVEKHGIEQHRFQRLYNEIVGKINDGEEEWMNLFDPICCIDWEDGEQTVIDGSHRVAVAAEITNVLLHTGKSITLQQYPERIIMNGWVVPKKLWKRFQIDGMSDASEEALANMYSGIP